MDNERVNDEFGPAIRSAMDLANLGVIAPHKQKYYDRYNINWLISAVESGEKLEYFTFWQADPGCENRIFSQWYQQEFVVNGRTYKTAEQYMMSEKALLFGDFDAYKAIMSESDPKMCKQLGRTVKNFDSKVWDESFREIIFHGNLGKLQGDLLFVDALLSTGNAVLVEASPLDDIYGAGMSKKDLLDDNGNLLVKPQNWHKKDSNKQAENNLGFVLMGVRDLLNDMMKPKLRFEEY